MLDIAKIVKTAAGRLVVRSALNPLLFFCAIVSLPCFGFAVSVHDDATLRWALFGVGFLPVGATAVIGLRFGFSCPEKLQSEEYQLRQQSLQMLQGATAPQVLDTDAVVAVAIANPVAPPALPEQAGGEQT